MTFKERKAIVSSQFVAATMYLVLDTETTGVICWAIYDAHGVKITAAHHIVRPSGFSIPVGAVGVQRFT